MAKIENHEFKDIFWDIYNLDKSLDLRIKFEREFSQIWPIWKRREKVEVNRMARYIIFMYDIKSPLRKFIKNIDERRNHAAGLAGYDVQNVPDSTKKRIIDGTDQEIIEGVFLFIAYRDNKNHAQLISNENLFWSYYKQLSTPIPDKFSKSDLESKQLLRKELKNIQQDIEDLEFAIYGGDKEVAEIVKQVRKMKTTPEHMAI